MQGVSWRRGDERHVATFSESISQQDGVDLFIVYCTATEKGDDAGLHDKRLRGVPSCLGVLGSDNMCGIHMIGLPRKKK